MFGWAELAMSSFFLGAALKSGAVLTAAWLSARLLRKKSAAIRHLMWTAAFAALLALPFWSLFLPALRVPMQPAMLPFGAQFETAASAPVTPATGQQKRAASTGHIETSRQQGLNWPFLLIFLWTTGTAASLAQMLLSCASIHRTRRAARPLHWQNFNSFAQRLGIGYPPELLEAEPGSMPMTSGLFRPAIFMPGDARVWTEERRRIVLLHELAHISRCDAATHLLARTALGVYWWNPLAWIAWREFLSERERAADDLVLSCGEEAAEYAGQLLDIARSMQSTPAMGGAAVAMARPRQLEERLAAILDDRRNRRRPGRASAAAVGLLAMMVAGPLGALRTQDSTAPSLPTDLESTIRAASAQKNPEILDKAAEMSEARGKFDVAQKLLDSALTIRGQVSGQQSSQYGVGLLKLADLAREQQKFDEAKILYTNALALLGSGPDAATALIHLGTVALASKQFDPAMDDLRRAQSLDAAKAGEAAVWMALTQQRQNNFDSADSLFQSAIAGEDPMSEAAAAAMELYAAFLDQQGRAEQAKSMNAQAAAIRKQLSQQSASQGLSPNVYRMGAGVSPPGLISKIEPIYSQEARIAKYQGTVLVRVEIGADGAAHNITVIRGLGLGLDERAVAAISQWKFNAGSKDGQPVTVMANIEVNFRLL